jgi:hypothetical protein
MRRQAEYGSGSCGQHAAGQVLDGPNNPSGRLHTAQCQRDDAGDQEGVRHPE